jgi:hypothetical protein
MVKGDGPEIFSTIMRINCRNDREALSPTYTANNPKVKEG